MRMRKSVSLIVVILLLSTIFITPVAAVESNGDVPKTAFNSIWDYVQDMIESINPEHEVMDSPVTVSEENPTEPAEEEEASAQVPVREEKPASTPAEEKPASTPVKEKPASAPAEEKPTPAPVKEKPAPAPVEEKPAPAPVEVKPAPTPVVEKPASAPAEEKPAPAPVEVKPAPAPAYTISDFEKEVVRLVNIEREKEGLKPLVMDTPLSKGARAKSQDMVDNRYFSHNSPKYGSPFDMMKAFGIRYSNAGENIASGQRSPASVVNAWMNSEGHRRNIMSPKYGKIGVGYAYTSNGNYNHYWTQWFTN